MANPDTVTPMTQVGSVPRDDNDSPVPVLGFQQTKTITFAAGTTGAVGTTTLFTVSGTASVNVYGFCTSDLAGSGTLEIGVAGGTASLCDQQAATAIDNHEVWHESVLAVGGIVAYHWHPVNQNVILTIASNTVSAGTITFYCNWVPLSQGATVVAA